MSRASGIERFSQALAAAGLGIEVKELGRSSHTALEAADAIGCEVAQIVKSLVLVADGEALMALVSGPRRVDEAALAARLGAAQLRPASAREAREQTGYPIGGIPPFGHATRLRTVLDPELLRHPLVWAAAGSPDAVFPIDPEELRRVSGAEVVEVVA